MSARFISQRRSLHLKSPTLQSVDARLFISQLFVFFPFSLIFDHRVSILCQINRDFFMLPTSCQLNLKQTFEKSKNHKMSLIFIIGSIVWYFMCSVIRNKFIVTVLLPKKELKTVFVFFSSKYPFPLISNARFQNGIQKMSMGTWMLSALSMSVSCLSAL